MHFAICLILAIAALHAPISEACRCARLQDPGYCRTDFVALVTVTESIQENVNSGRQYRIEVLSDLSFGKNAGLLEGFKEIVSEHPAACGVYLEAHKTYLLGGTLAEGTHQPSLNSCNAYWREWEYSGEKSAGHLEDIRKECDAFHRNSTKIVPN